MSKAGYHLCSNPLHFLGINVTKKLDCNIIALKLQASENTRGQPDRLKEQISKKMEFLINGHEYYENERKSKDYENH